MIGGGGGVFYNTIKGWGQSSRGTNAFGEGGGIGVVLRGKKRTFGRK